MELFEMIAKNPEGVSFSLLFIALLVYVMKTNDKRETKYQETIETLSKALNTFEDLKEKINSLVKGRE